MSKKPPAPPKPDQFVPGATYRVRDADWSVFWGEGLDHVAAQKLKSSVVGQRKSTTAVIENEKLGPPAELEERAVAARQKLRSTPVAKFRVREADWSKIWGEDLLEQDAVQLKNKVVGERKSKTATVEAMDIPPPISVTAPTPAAPADPQLAQIQASALAKAGDTAKAAQARSDAAIARQKAAAAIRRLADEAEAESKKIEAEIAEADANPESFMSKMVRDLSPEERAELEAADDDDGGIEELIAGGGDVPTDEEIALAKEQSAKDHDAACEAVKVGSIVVYFPSENTRISSMAVVLAVKVPGKVLDLRTGITPDMLIEDSAIDGHIGTLNPNVPSEEMGPWVSDVPRYETKRTGTWDAVR